MLQKMKDRIASNKIQASQIIDQLTTNIGQQILNSNTSATNDDSIPHQTLPEFQEESLGSHETVSNMNDSEPSSSARPKDGSSVYSNEGSANVGISYDDELNQEISPQHQLYDQQSIRRIDFTNQSLPPEAKLIAENNRAVIDIDGLSSDLEDAEIDLLFSVRTKDSEAGIKHDVIDKNLSTYREKYRTLVHTIRRLDQEHKAELCMIQSQLHDLTDQLNSSKKELLQIKQSKTSHCDSSTLSASSSQSDNIDKNIPANQVDGRASPSQCSSSLGKQIRKIRDLEKLIAKCKESLKNKNSQIKILRESLLKVDQFKEIIDEVKSDLTGLKKSYEIWTVSVAENKRIMHQEMEDKISEMERYKAEIRDLQLQIRDYNSKIINFKSNVQNLESRLVSTSAAHLKERESLIKELNASKSNALNQQKREFEIQKERIKLDLEKSIEALKSEVLSKDEQIIRSATNQQKLHEQNQQYVNDLTAMKMQLENARALNERLQARNSHLEEENCELKTQLEKMSIELGATLEASELESQLQSVIQDLENYKTRFIEAETSMHEYKDRCQHLEHSEGELHTVKADLESKLRELDELRDELAREISSKSILSQKSSELERKLSELERHLNELESDNMNLKTEISNRPQEIISDEHQACEKCQQLDKEAKEAHEKYEQTFHELNRRLDTLTSANSDQERAYAELERNHENSQASIRSLKSELEDNIKKNESLVQKVKDNEEEIQQLQESIDKLSNLKLENETLKKDHNNSIAIHNQVKQEISERNQDIARLKDENDGLSKKLSHLNSQHDEHLKSIETLRQERDALSNDLMKEIAKRDEMDKKLVIALVSALRNLETPDNSPGSDKTFKEANDVQELEDNGDWSQDEHSDSLQVHDEQNTLPDPLRLADNLSSLSLTRSTAYSTLGERLKAVLLENRMISDELLRLKDEMNSLNREKSQEVQHSLDEIERLRTENQALIHDQKAYDDQISLLKNEIETVVTKLNSTKIGCNCFERGEPNSEESNTVMVEAADEDLEARYKELDELLVSKEEEIRNLRRTIEENSVLIEKQKNVPKLSAEASVAEDAQSTSTISHPKQQNPSLEPEPAALGQTEYEYLKNIVYQFMIGREPVTLARVISAVFRFEKDQVEQICKIQEAIHQITS